MKELPASGDGMSAARRRRAWLVALAMAVLAVAAVSRLRDGSLRGRTELRSSPATLTRLTDLPGREWFPSLAPEGNLFVYARKASGGNRLFLQQVKGGMPLDLLPDSRADDSQPALSPDGRQIAFRSDRDGGGIFLMGLAGESLRRIASAGFNPAWSPDGQEILYATEGVDNPRTRRHPSRIYRVHLATGRRRLVHERDAVQPSWSPRGSRIAYWGFSPSGQRQIWTLPAQGGVAVQVTGGQSVDWNPVWSPDGRHLYFASDRSGINNLWRVRIDERTGRVLGEPEAVATSGQASMLFSLSRDGRRIVYASEETRTILEKVAFDPARGVVTSPPQAIVQTSSMIAAFDVSRDQRSIVYQTSVPQEDFFLIQPDGTGLRRLTRDKFKDRLPRWSPDGSRIAFYSNRGGKYEIWSIRADGRQLAREAMTTGRQVYHPIWSPDGRRLACDLGENAGILDLTLPVAERRPLLLPTAGRGMGFSASSWSTDGRWLAGSLHQPDGRQLPGVILYSLASRRYLRITARGEGATWLSDSRRLLYWDSGKLLLLDTRSRTSRLVLTAPAGSDYNDFCLSADDRVLYLARNIEHGDIWLLAMQ